MYGNSVQIEKQVVERDECEKCSVSWNVNYIELLQSFLFDTI